MSDRTVPALLAVALAGALAYGVTTSADKHQREMELSTRSRELRDAYLREANASHDPRAALRAIALDEKLGGSKQWAQPRGELRRALFEANFAARPGDKTIHLDAVPVGHPLVRNIARPWLIDGRHVFSEGGGAISHASFGPGGDRRLEYPDTKDLEVEVDPSETTLLAYPRRPSSSPLRVFDVDKGSVRFSLDVPQGAHAVLAPTGQRLYVTRNDTSTLYDLATKKPIGAVPSGIACFSNDGKRLAIGTKDKLAIFDEGGHEVVSKPGSWPPFAFAASGERLVIRKGFADEAVVYVLDSKTLAEIAKREANLRNDANLQVAGDTIALRDSFSTSLLDARTGKSRGVTGWMDRSSLSADGRRIVLGNFGFTDVHDTSDEKKEPMSLREISSHDDLSSLALSADGTRAAAAFRPPLVRVWDVSTGDLDAAIPTSRRPDWVALSRDGNELVFGESELGRARAYDLSYERHVAFACTLVQQRSFVGDGEVKDFCATRKR